MKDYLKKVLFYRSILLILVLLCYFLQRNNLTDYVIVIALFILFMGIFSLSHVEVTSREVIIKKNYFWGLVGVKWVLVFKQITELKTKNYEINAFEDDWMFTESLFASFAVDFFRPKVRWLRTTLCYLDNGSEKDIELKMSREDYRDIDRRIRRNPYL